ncbi:hypothetical protein BU069_13010 [Staphylococcus succinus]|nr:hypothetical protein BU069_13010 [Staphylococcus succinus]
MNNIIEYIGFHGTMKSNFDKIDKLKKFKSNVLPNDLGNGLYFFINRKDKIEEAIHNANLYLKRWKPKYENKVIVEVLMELYNESVLDLDEVENQEVFNLFVEENQEDIYNEIQNLKPSNSFNRGQFDGLIIEMMIKHFNLNIQAILKETYTQFDESKLRKRSNIPNGRELCLRDYKAIKSKCICEKNTRIS